VRAEQKQLAKAVALAADIPELVAELQQRSAWIQNLEAQLIAAKSKPAELAALVNKVEANVRTNVAFPSQVRPTCARSSRPCYRAPNFEPARTPDGARQVWKISGGADFRTRPSQRARFGAGPVSFSLRP
jgi:hypothetical protein